MQQKLPKQVNKYFWGDDLNQLNWQKHKKYIIKTLLEKGDLESLSWMFKKVNKKEVKKILPSLKLSSKSTNFWNLYLT